MTLGQLNTFHFFPYAGLTYNEKLEPGIERGGIYFQPHYDNHALSDVVRIQAINATAVFLRAYEEDGTTSGEFALANTGTVWDLNFLPPTTSDDDVFKVFVLGTKPAGVWTPAFRTDPIQFIHDSFGTVFVQVANKYTYSGMDFSGDKIFGIRLSAKFFKEREIEVDESEELSDETVVKLSGSVKSQKQLQVEPIPNYQKRRLKLAVKCNTLAIDGVQYIQEEAFSDTELNEKFGMVATSVWLTLKDGGFITNVFGEAVEVSTTGSEDAEKTCDEGATYLGGPVDTPSGITYFNEPDGANQGWGCILSNCAPVVASWLWDDGDEVLWDDGDEIKSED